MIPQGMTNEQFALWLAVKMPSHTQETFDVADNLYKWLEKKQEDKQKKTQADVKYYLGGQEVDSSFFPQVNIKMEPTNSFESNDGPKK